VLAILPYHGRKAALTDEGSCQAISREITKRTIYRDADDQGQEVHTDDYEDDEELRDRYQWPV